MKAESRIGMFIVHGFEKIFSAFFELEIIEFRVVVDVLPVFGGEDLVRGAYGFGRTVYADQMNMLTDCVANLFGHHG